MKKAVLLPMLFFCSFGLCQSKKVNDILPLDDNGNVVITFINTVDSLTADYIYSKAKICISEIYVSGKSATQLADDQLKTIVVKAVIKNTSTWSFVKTKWGYTKYSLKIECKDGKYRLTFSDFYHKNNDWGSAVDGGDLNQERGRSFNNKSWRAIQQQALDEVTFISELFKKSISKVKDDF